MINQLIGTIKSTSLCYCFVACLYVLTTVAAINANFTV